MKPSLDRFMNIGVEEDLNKENLF